MKFNSSEIPKISDDDENKLESNLVWIFASLRSGTTWLGTELLRFQTKIINEPMLSAHLGNLMPEGHPFLTNYEMFQARGSHYFFSKKFEPVWKFYLRKLILNRIFAQTNEINSKTIIKEPGGAGYFMISKCLPKSKIILLLRDGRDVIDSLLNASMKDGWAAKQSGKTEGLSVKERLPFIRRRAFEWKNRMKILKKLKDSHPKENLYELKYEKLRTNTEEELRKIYEFLEIKIEQNELAEIVEKYAFENLPSEVKGDGKKIRSASTGKWKNHFTEEEKQLVNKILNDTLKYFGYSV